MKISRKHFKEKNVDWWDPDENDEFLLDQVSRINELILASKMDRILEVGTGRGRITKALRSLGKDVTGIDINPSFAKITKYRLNDAEIIIADVENLPFKPESFDGIITIETFLHFPRPLESLKEMNRVLEPKGTLIMNFHRKYSIGYVRHLRRRLWSRLRDGWVDYRYDTWDTIGLLLQRAGFRQDKVSMRKSSLPLLKLTKI
jgi:ubiquinone/menaquinone biosynthesis C-methylase UbiE